MQRLLAFVLLASGACASVPAADPHDLELERRVARLEEIMKGREGERRSAGVPVRVKSGSKLKISGDLRLRYQAESRR